MGVALTGRTSAENDRVVEQPTHRAAAKIKAISLFIIPILLRLPRSILLYCPSETVAIKSRPATKRGKSPESEPSDR